MALLQGNANRILLLKPIVSTDIAIITNIIIVVYTPINTISFIPTPTTIIRLTRKMPHDFLDNIHLHREAMMISNSWGFSWIMILPPL